MLSWLTSEQHAADPFLGLAQRLVDLACKAPATEHRTSPGLQEC